MSETLPRHLQRPVLPIPTVWLAITLIKDDVVVEKAKRTVGSGANAATYHGESTTVTPANTCVGVAEVQEADITVANGVVTLAPTHPIAIEQAKFPNHQFKLAPAGLTTQQIRDLVSTIVP